MADNEHRSGFAYATERAELAKQRESASLEVLKGVATLGVALQKHKGDETQLEVIEAKVELIKALNARGDGDLSGAIHKALAPLGIVHKSAWIDLDPSAEIDDAGVRIAVGKARLPKEPEPISKADAEAGVEAAITAALKKGRR